MNRFEPPKELQDRWQGEYEERVAIEERPIPAVSGAIYMVHHEKVEDLTDFAEAMETNEIREGEER